MGTTSAGVSWSGSWSTSAKSFAWMIVAKPVSDTSSHIVLRNKSAKPEEMEEVWQTIEECAKRQ